MRHKVNSSAIALWLFAVVSYIYSQSSIYGCLFSLGLLVALHLSGANVHWGSLCRGWALSILLFTTFYAVFIRVEGTVIFSIGGNIPLVSGPVTVESIYRGVIIGTTLTLSLYFFSLFADIFRHQGMRFYLPGIFRHFSMFCSFSSLFVSLLFTHHRLFAEKQKNRQLQLSLWQKLRLFMHDSSFFSLENAFSLTEVLELRIAKTRLDRGQRFLSNVLLVGLVLIFGTIVAVRIEPESSYKIAMGIFIGIEALLLVMMIRRSMIAKTFFEGAFAPLDVVLLGISIVAAAYFILSPEVATGLSLSPRFDWKPHVVFVILGMTLIFHRQKRRFHD